LAAHDPHPKGDQLFGLDFGAVYDGSKVNIHSTQTTMKLSTPSWYGIQKLLIRAASGSWIHRPLSNSSLVPAATAGGLAWEHLGPVLDSAIDELSSTNRNVVVLRFLERLEMSDIGKALDVSEESARQRVERALDELRDALVPLGFNSASVALSSILLNRPIQPIPNGLTEALILHVLAATRSEDELSDSVQGILTKQFALLPQSGIASPGIRTRQTQIGLPIYPY
jgi:hypothetical protein